MSLSMYSASVPVFIRMLNNLAAILGKAGAYAEEKGIKPAVLPSARLYPDMLPLTAQVQIACDTAKKCGVRLAGVEAPVNEDNETTLDELIARIGSTVAYLEKLKPGQIDGTDDKPVRLELPGTTMDFVGADYLTGFALPNFYFHVATAYAILRHNGLVIGKRDFLGG